jgi:hypothetical protein
MPGTQVHALSCGRDASCGFARRLIHAASPGSGPTATSAASSQRARIRSTVAGKSSAASGWYFEARPTVSITKRRASNAASSSNAAATERSSSTTPCSSSGTGRRAKPRAPRQRAVKAAPLSRKSITWSAAAQPAQNA